MKNMISKRKKILVIIPARKGSKRLPGKNTMTLCGKPMIAWSIEAATHCSFVDAVLVSTDSLKIADVSKQFGAEVPYLRPKRLATDKASSMDVILDVLNYFDKKSAPFDIVVLLQPTSPLRTARHLSEALELFILKRAEAVVSVAEESHPPGWAVPLNKNLTLARFPRVKDKNPHYRINGAIYIAAWEFLKKNKNWYSDRTFAYVMDRKSSVDIDTREDFWVAELFMNKNK